jgi:glycosyltransferase involved in cell wall biosynthesis
MQTTISCVVPVFNGERYVAEALESIFRQTHPVAELIVVDDGSEDRTPDVVAEFGDRVRYIRQANSGAPAARNRGLRESSGSFVSFLDADDLWQEEKLASQLARFECLDDLDVCVGHARNFWVEELREEERLYEGRRRSRPIPAYVSSTMLARRNVFEEIGSFDPELRHGHDVEWFIRAAEHGVVIDLIPDVVLYRRMHSAGISRIGARKSLDAHLAIIKASLDRRRKVTDAAAPYAFPGSVEEGQDRSETED